MLDSKVRVKVHGPIDVRLLNSMLQMVLHARAEGILLRLKAESRRGEKIFKTSPSKVRRAWNRAARDNKFDPGPLHTLRHVGPSEDALGTPEEGPYRSLPQIQVRGRWKLLQSVLRYAKIHPLLRARAETPTRILEYGAQEIASLGKRASMAIV